MKMRNIILLILSILLIQSAFALSDAQEQTDGSFIEIEIEKRGITDYLSALFQPQSVVSESPTYSTTDKIVLKFKPEMSDYEKQKQGCLFFWEAKIELVNEDNNQVEKRFSYNKAKGNALCGTKNIYKIGLVPSSSGFKAGNYAVILKTYGVKYNYQLLQDNPQTFLVNSEKSNTFKITQSSNPECDPAVCSDYEIISSENGKKLRKSECTYNLKKDGVCTETGKSTRYKTICGIDYVIEGTESRFADGDKKCVEVKKLSCTKTGNDDEKYTAELSSDAQRVYVINYWKEVLNTDKTACRQKTTKSEYIIKCNEGYIIEGTSKTSTTFDFNSGKDIDNLCIQKDDGGDDGGETFYPQWELIDNQCFFKADSGVKPNEITSFEEEADCKKLIREDKTVSYAIVDNNCIEVPYSEFAYESKEKCESNLDSGNQCQIDSDCQSPNLSCSEAGICINKDNTVTYIIIGLFSIIFIGGLVLLYVR